MVFYLERHSYFILILTHSPLELCDTVGGIGTQWPSLSISLSWKTWCLCCSWSHDVHKNLNFPQQGSLHLIVALHRPHCPHVSFKGGTHCFITCSYSLCLTSPQLSCNANSLSTQHCVVVGFQPFRTCFASSITLVNST